jgi:hypothetical protein
MLYKTFAQSAARVPRGRSNAAILENVCPLALVQIGVRRGPRDPVFLDFARYGRLAPTVTREFQQQASSFVVFGNEVLVADGGTRVLSAVERRQFQRWRRQVLVWNHAEKVPDYIQSRVLLVVRIHYIPGRLLDVSMRAHLIFGSRILFEETSSMPLFAREPRHNHDFF